MGYTGTVLTLPERIVAFLEEVDRPLTRGEFIYYLRGPHETAQRVQAGLDDLVQRGRVRKVPAKPRKYGPYPEVSYELVKTAPDLGDRSADQNGVLRIRRSATPEPDQRDVYEALGVPTEIIRRQSHFPA